ncbi:hypothetical protein MA16_Dca015203 [Dendrobium catenatum]|uniref:Uncharacterized protein n=1 Tax=Dendrobium catenatum TaxID=906689 RepID=A0A2I0XAN0_9ASPA|nr:hypothetical protein MA16_Dca015203 [Dendrobium catenatum]
MVRGIVVGGRWRSRCRSWRDRSRWAMVVDLEGGHSQRETMAGGTGSGQREARRLWLDRGLIVMGGSKKDKKQGNRWQVLATEETDGGASEVAARQADLPSRSPGNGRFSASIAKGASLYDVGTEKGSRSTGAPRSGKENIHAVAKASVSCSPMATASCERVLRFIYPEGNLDRGISSPPSKPAAVRELIMSSIGISPPAGFARGGRSEPETVSGQEKTAMTESRNNLDRGSGRVSCSTSLSGKSEMCSDGSSDMEDDRNEGLEQPDAILVTTSMAEDDPNHEIALGSAMEVLDGGVDAHNGMAEDSSMSGPTPMDEPVGYGDLNSRAAEDFEHQVSTVARMVYDPNSSRREPSLVTASAPTSDPRVFPTTVCENAPNLPAARNRRTLPSVPGTLLCGGGEANPEPFMAKIALCRKNELKPLPFGLAVRESSNLKRFRTKVSTPRTIPPWTLRSFSMLKDQLKTLHPARSTFPKDILGPPKPF